MVLSFTALLAGTLGRMYHMWLRLRPPADQTTLQLFVLYLPVNTIVCVAPQLTSN